MKKTLFATALLLCALTVSARPYKHSVGLNMGSASGISYKGYIGDSEHFITVLDLNCKVGVTKGAYFYNQYPSNSLQKYYEAEYGKDSEYFRHSDKKGKYVYWTCEFNPNLGYQREIADFGGATMQWFIGGGISVGMAQIASYGDGVTQKDAWKSMKDARKAYHDILKDNDHDDHIYAGVGGLNLKGGKDIEEYHRPYVFKAGINLLTGFEVCFKNAPVALGIDVRPGCTELLDFTVTKEIPFVEGGKEKTSEDATRIYSMTHFDWSASMSLRFLIGQ